MASLIQQCCCHATDIAQSYAFVTADRSWGDESGLAGDGNAAQSVCWHLCAKALCWGWTVACMAPKMDFNLLFFPSWYQSKILPFLKGRQRCRRCIHSMVVLASSSIHNQHHPIAETSGVLGLQSSRKAVSKYKTVLLAKNTDKVSGADIYSFQHLFLGRELERCFHC